MAQIQPIDIQVTQLIGRLSAINTREIPLAQARALNRVLSSGTTALSRNLAGRLKLPQRKIKRRLFQDKAKPVRLVARLRVYHRGVMAIDLPGIRDKGRYKKGRRGRVGTGVSARGGYRFKKAFIAKGSGGIRQVFQRDASNKLDAIDIKIKSKAERLASPTLNRALRQQYANTLRRELQFRLSKYGN